jgi:hypothetical protein
VERGAEFCIFNRVHVTKHAKDRMGERGIALKEVVSVLKSKETEYISSDSKKGVVKAINSKKNLTVVFVPEKQSVITVYKIRKAKRSKP